MLKQEHELRREAGQKLDEAKAIQAKADDEKRAVSKEETEKIDALLAEQKGLLEDADRRARIGAADDLMEKGASRPVRRDLGTALVSAEARDPVAEGRRGFQHLGEFAESVIRAYDPSRRALDQRLTFEAAASGLSAGIGADGGFLIPPTFSKQIWDGLNREVDNLIPLCDTYTVEGESLTFNAVAETSRVTGSRYGGMLAYWIAEAQQIGSAKPKFRQMKLEPQQLAVLIFATDKLLRNAGVALEQYLRKCATDEILWYVNNAIINGNGVGQPLGIMNSASLITVAKETNQVADSILEANLAKMWSRLHPRSRSTAVWLANVDVEPQLDALFQPVKNVAGTENVGGYKSSAYNGEKQTIKGRPVKFIEYAQTIGDLGDIMLVDFGAYALGLRGGVQSAVSIHLRFDYAETCFRFMFEVDGQPWLGSALTPANGSNTLSTHVTLAVRG